MKTASFSASKLPLVSDIHVIYQQLCESENRRVKLEQINALLQENNHLLEDTTNLLKDKLNFLEEEIERLKGFLRLSRHKTFGSQSEKLDAQAQLSLGLNPHSHEPTGQESEEPVCSTTFIPIAQKPGRRPLPAVIERKQVIYDLSSTEKVCKCGNSLHKIGEEVTEQIDYVPAKAFVLQNVRYKYGCKKCEETVRIAPLPLQPLPRSVATPRLLAHVLVSKYVDRTPVQA